MCYIKPWLACSHHMLTPRRDVLARFNASVPDTWDELVEALQAINGRCNVLIHAYRMLVRL